VLVGGFLAVVWIGDALVGGGGAVGGGAGVGWFAPFSLLLLLKLSVCYDCCCCGE